MMVDMNKGIVMIPNNCWFLYELIYWELLL